MKYFVLILILTGCTPSEDYKSIRQQVLAAHDSVMADSEHAIHNRMKLDTLSRQLDLVKSKHPAADTSSERIQINALRSKLNDADAQMMHWMEEFDAELGKKSNEEAITYFKGEKQKIRELDSVFQKVLKQSDGYLKKY